MHAVLALSAVLSLLMCSTHAHMEVKTPPPRRSKFYPFATNIDYNMMAPLEADGSNFPCKNYPPGQVVAEFKAGSMVQVDFAGSTYHEGGHCQFSIRYNNGAFISVYTRLGDCFTGTGNTIRFKLPSDFPTCEKCTFAWTWVNAIGNREYYMNCADASIVNPDPTITSYTGQEMVVLNLPGYPYLPEFGNDPTVGTEYYKISPLITINIGGDPSSAPSSTSPPPTPISPPLFPTSPPYQTASPPPKAPNHPNSPRPPFTNPPPASPSSPPDTGCTEGKHKCTSDSTGYAQCSHDVWHAFECSSGTSCYEVDGSIVCAYTPPLPSEYSTSPPPPSPSPSPTDDSTQCTEGEMKCTSETQYATCSHDVWYKLECAAGTTCYSSGESSIVCDW